MNHEGRDWHERIHQAAAAAVAAGGVSLVPVASFVSAYLASEG